MSLPSNFKFHECDKLIVFKYVYPVILPFSNKYDLLNDGRPRIFLENDRGERLPAENVSNQIQTVAYNSREAMVKTCLDVCRFLSGQSGNTKLFINGCFFLRTAISHVCLRLRHFPENPDFDGALQELPRRDVSFYDADFWNSSLVQSWLIVHSVYEWYELYMKRWALSVADTALASR